MIITCILEINFHFYLILNNNHIINNLEIDSDFKDIYEV